MLKHYLAAGRAKADFRGVTRVTRIGIDETSAWKGHDYITMFVDLDRGALLFTTSGKDKDTHAVFVKDFVQHGGNPEAIKEYVVIFRQHLLPALRSSSLMPP